MPGSLSQVAPPGTAAERPGNASRSTLPSMVSSTYNGGMRGASQITVVAGGLLVAAAWAIGAFYPFGEHRAITDILAEVIAVLIIILAWRYRRDRLAIAALVVAAANLLVRTGHITSAEGAAGAVLSMVISLDLCLISLTRDRPLWRPAWVIWLAVVASQMWFAGYGMQLADPRLLTCLEDPRIPPAALLGGGIIILATFMIRRTSFEGSLVWVIAACAAALVDWRGSQGATLFFAAAQLALLVGLFEDSYRLAFHDELTGLPGRRALEEAMRGLGGTFSIAMVDIDHFKRFNDRHGHDAGDQVLRMVADELAKTGGGGRAYRYGGEEFTILFSGKGIPDLRGDLDSVRSSIADRTFALRAPDRPRTKPDKPGKKGRPAKRVTVTVSIGAASSNSRRPSPASVLRAADKALYRAKRAGRNRLVAAGDRLPKRG